MAGYPKRPSIVRGDHIAVSQGSMSMIFTVDEFLDVFKKGRALCDVIARRQPFPRDNHLNDSELSGGNRRVGSSDDGGQL